MEERCVCGKVSYRTRREAIKALNRFLENPDFHHDKRARYAYPCKRRKVWHLTSRKRSEYREKSGESA